MFWQFNDTKCRVCLLRKPSGGSSLNHPCGSHRVINRGWLRNSIKTTKKMVETLLKKWDVYIRFQLVIRISIH